MMARVRVVIAGSIVAAVDVEGGRVDVHEDRRAAGVVHGAGGGEEGEGRGDDLVAGLEVECHQREQQRVGAGGAADGVPGVAEPGHVRLEGRNLGAHDELLPLDDRHQSGQDRVLGRLVLRRQVEQRNPHGKSPGRQGAQTITASKLT